MSIVSSVYTLGPVEIDGRRLVVETHTDNTGAKIFAQYLASPGVNYLAVAAARAALIDERLKQEEALRVFATDAKPVLVYQTAAEVATRFWAAVAAAYLLDKVGFEALLWWLTNRLVAGDITDAQALATFNAFFGRSLTAAQWTSLRTSRITPAHDRYQAIITEAAL